jgi:hypothetical protein
MSNFGPSPPSPLPELEVSALVADATVVLGPSPLPPPVGPVLDGPLEASAEMPLASDAESSPSARVLPPPHPHASASTHEYRVEVGIVAV